MIHYREGGEDAEGEKKFLMPEIDFYSWLDRLGDHNLQILLEQNIIRLHSSLVNFKKGSPNFQQAGLAQEIEGLMVAIKNDITSEFEKNRFTEEYPQQRLLQKEMVAYFQKLRIYLKEVEKKERAQSTAEAGARSKAAGSKSEVTLPRKMPEMKLIRWLGRLDDEALQEQLGANIAQLSKDLHNLEKSEPAEKRKLIDEIDFLMKDIMRTIMYKFEFNTKNTTAENYRVQQVLGEEMRAYFDKLAEYLEELKKTLR